MFVLFVTLKLIRKDLKPGQQSPLNLEGRTETLVEEIFLGPQNVLFLTIRSPKDVNPHVHFIYPKK